MTLQELPKQQRIIAEKIINDTLFLAEMGSLTISHTVPISTMKRRSDHLLELALKEEDVTNSNKRFETVTTDRKAREDKEEKPTAKRTSEKVLTEEDLIKLLELEEDDLEIENSQENVSDDCLYSDASEDATQLNEDTTQVCEDDNINSNEISQLASDEWKTERDPSILLLNVLDPKIRMRLWKDVTVPEIKTFFGILFHMGTIKINRVTDYWKKHPLFNLPAFSKYMSRIRFLLIMRSLNFEDALSNNMLSKININGSVSWQKASLRYKTLYPNRRIWSSYEDYCIYAGAFDTLLGGANHSEKVVLNLLSNYVNKVNLAQKLLTLKTYCSGTLRVNRKNNPKEVLERELKRGESIAKLNNSGICVLKWQDRRDVLMISSQHGSDMTSVTNRRGETVSKPEVIVKYNRYMDGIDHQNQMLAYYSCEHKTIRWYKKLGVNVFQQLLYKAGFSVTRTKTQLQDEVQLQNNKCTFFSNVLAKMMAQREKFYDAGVGSAGFKKKSEKTLHISVPLVPNNMEGNDPFDYFNLLANEEFFSMLVTKANSYAGKLVSQIKHPNSRLKLWKDITISEMKTFFGLLFHMGIKSVNRLLENAPFI
ncbi:hypothetical protein HW555_006481 [Spodoptera exigua]|uniref:PiggyBac transposable element-derived protein domain-containing protein n=1 Tax=Spodoptera exigua TaxID=7107 RepID=A0A835GHW2_SPOEX|nr:hypothetical protein HW555_006481 [Spodoptera exigua]